MIDIYGNNILITGGTGLLGGELKNHFVNAMFPTRKEFNLLWSAQRMASALQKYKAELVINCAAVLNHFIDMGDDDSMAAAYCTNVSGVSQLCQACNRSRTQVVQISTDYIFDGKTPPYNEFRVPNPVNFYSFTKVMSEAYVAYVGGHTIRTSFCAKDKWMFPGAYDNVYSSRDTVDVIAELITRVIERLDGWHGNLHVGTERKSFYELAKKINPEVKRIESKDPRDTSFDLTNMEKLLGFCQEDKDAI